MLIVRKSHLWITAGTFLALAVALQGAKLINTDTRPSDYQQIGDLQKAYQLSPTELGRNLEDLNSRSERLARNPRVAEQASRSLQRIAHGNEVLQRQWENLQRASAIHSQLNQAKYRVFAASRDARLDIENAIESASVVPAQMLDIPAQLNTELVRAIAEGEELNRRGISETIADVVSRLSQNETLNARSINLLERAHNNVAAAAEARREWMRAERAGQVSNQIQASIQETLEGQGSHLLSAVNSMTPGGQFGRLVSYLQLMLMLGATGSLTWAVIMTRKEWSEGRPAWATDIEKVEMAVAAVSSAVAGERKHSAVTLSEYPELSKNLNSIQDRFFDGQAKDVARLGAIEKCLNDCQSIMSSVVAPFGTLLDKTQQAGATWRQMHSQLSEPTLDSKVESRTNSLPGQSDDILKTASVKATSTSDNVLQLQSNLADLSKTLDNASGILYTLELASHGKQGTGQAVAGLRTEIQGINDTYELIMATTQQMVGDATDMTSQLDELRNLLNNVAIGQSESEQPGGRVGEQILAMSQQVGEAITEIRNQIQRARKDHLTWNEKALHLSGRIEAIADNGVNT